MISSVHLTGILLTFIIVSALGVYSVRYVKSSRDFAVGSRSMGPVLVAASVIASFVGGTSIIGTAQMAFHYGVSGIWFTLGAGISCLIAGLFLARPLREAEVDTIPQFLQRAYARPVGAWASLFISLGMYIQIIAQLLAAIPLLRAILPLNPLQSGAVALAIIIGCVIFGGFWGTSLVGLLKTALLCISLFAAGIAGFGLIGGWPGLRTAFPPEPWFSMFPHGAAAELAAGFSVVVGFVSTQAYLQPIFASKDVRAARAGALLVAVLVPLIGAAGVLVGMFMRVRAPLIDPGQAVPRFVLEYLPPWLGGVAVATLFISLIMTGASLLLSVSIMFTQDVYREFFRRRAKDRELLIVSRTLIFLLAVVALFFTYTNVNSLILKWAFLSMTLRGVTVFLPLLGAIFLRDKIHPRAGLLAVSVAPAAALAWAVAFPGGIDPFYIGIALSAAFLTGGMIFRRKSHAHPKHPDLPW
ncbi:MAG: sodium:solute symporter family protein [Bacillota bacterium]